MSSENLILNKSATQSSQSHSGDPGRAVDGNSYGVYEIGNSCTHTYGFPGTTNPWWRGDLGSSRSVSEVFLVNRVGVYSHRLDNMEIRVGK